MAQHADPVRAGPIEEFGFFRHMVDDFYGFRKMMGGSGADAWMPPTDVYETPRHVVIKMCVPGIRAADVRVLFSGETVTICGYRSPSQEAGVLAYHQMEIRNGYFERRVVIHRPVDPQGASAEYRDGFLWLRIPRTSAYLERVIAVRIRV